MGNQDISLINIVYDSNQEEINLFGYEFIKNNKNRCKMIIDNKEYEIREKYNFKNYNFNEYIIIKLKIIGDITNISYMFYGCSSLLLLHNNSNWNIKNVTNMSYMFYGCE